MSEQEITPSSYSANSISQAAKTLFTVISFKYFLKTAIKDNTEVI